MAGIEPIVAGDTASFEALLQSLMSTKNEERDPAEHAFNLLKLHPDACVSQLVRSLRYSQHVESRALCAVLLRKVLTREDHSLWPKLSPAVQTTVKNEMLHSLKEEQLKTIARKVSDCVAELGAGLMEENQWPELTPFIFHCVQSGQENLMEYAFLIFEQLARYVMPVLVSYKGTLHDALAGGLNHSSMDVKLAAFKATVSFIEGLETQSDRDQFQSMIPLLLGVIGAALNVGDEIAAQDAVERFIELADEQPRFLRKQLPDIVNAMLQIAETDSLDAGTRRLAAEFLVTLCEAREKAPGMMRKLPQFVHRLFAVCISFLLDVEDDPAWHTAEDEKTENEGEGELFEFGQECLDRVAIALGGKSLVPIAGETLPILLADSADWRKRHAALMCLAQIAEGCVKVMSEEAIMTQLVALCLRGAADSNAKVRWAACQAVGQLCTDLGPDLQESQHEAVVPALMSLMDDFSNPRVQAHACAATVNFAENADQDVMAPYLDCLIGKLLALLQNGRKNVQEAALTSLASVADCAQEYFIKYYDTCIPLLRHVLEHARDRSHQLMRAKALECISLVGMAVGKERFGADAAQVLQYIQAVQSGGLDPDDPFASYMMQAGARICTTLGSDFIPYLPIVMPAMLEAAKLQPDVIVRDDDDGDGDDGDVNGDDDGDMETFIVGNRRVSLHTSVLEEKANACTMLCCYAYELKEGFFPYVEEVTQIMVPLLKFYFNEEVRSSAAQALPELLRSAVEAAKKGMGPDEAFCRTMAGFIWPPLVEVILKEHMPELVGTFMTSADEVLEVAEGPKLLPIDAVAPIFNAFSVVLTEYEERRSERMERARGEDFDAEEQEALEEEHEAETELLDAMGTLLNRILKCYGDAALPSVEGIIPAVTKLLEKNRFAEEKRVALSLMDDMIHYSPSGAAKYIAIVMPQLLDGASSKEHLLRQCCVYGIGQAAEKQGDAFKPYAPAAVQSILAILQSPTARGDDDELLVTENAVSALGKILEKQPDCVDPGLGALFIQNLPIEEDETEAKVVHSQLMRMVRASDARILGENNAHLPKIVDVVIRVLASGESLIAPGDVQEMAALLKQMQSGFPAEIFNGYVAALKPKQQANLKAVLEGISAA